jgi:hypothetical protein
MIRGPDASGKNNTYINEVVLKNIITSEASIG